MFDAMIESFKDDSVRILFNIKIQTLSKQEFEQQKQQRLQQNQKSETK